MSKFLRWIPSLFVMTTIFIMSSTPSTSLPSYGMWDMLIKKGGHMTGYGLLSVSILYGLDNDRKKNWLAWLLAVLFALSDEFHQSFTPGRNPSLVDVFVFDGGGAALGLGIMAAWLKYQQRKSG